ncbi:MAG: hypothetical protein ACTSQ8_07870 [Candidatus Helarchaeota archaeon]
MTEENKDELIQWFEELYEKETFKIEYHGKTFKFKKYFPVSLLSKIENLDTTLKSKYLISFISIEPKISLQAVDHLPTDLMGRIVMKIKEYNNYNLGEQQETSQPESI